jgi:dTDP-glucose pyrophosphorylase/SAM-dependent methyltransferase
MAGLHALDMAPCEHDVAFAGRGFLTLMSMLQIVIPMAGRGSRFAQAGFTVPKPLIPMGGRPMIQWVIENIRPTRPHQFTFICLAEHLSRYPEVSAELRRLCPSCNIVPVDAVTEGAACTVLLAREIIDSDDPLMIANSDQIADLPIDVYLTRGDAPDLAGLIMTFWADHPKWSYCRMREDGTVSEVVEKQVVSNEATVGIYNFGHGKDFVRAADAMIDADLRVNGEFYVAPCYNQLIAKGATILTARTGREHAGMYGLGTPEDLESFKTTRYYQDRMLRSASVWWRLASKMSRVLALFRSSDARDRIQLQHRIDRLPLIGQATRLFKKIRARAVQRSPEDYVKMQKQSYECYASADRVTPGDIDGDYVVGSWRAHDGWPDYNDYLMKYVPRDESWLAIEYGCGPGRNLRRWSSIFRRIDGVDISTKNLENALVFLGDLPPSKKPNLYVTHGMDCGNVPKGSYDFAFSTICLQHICVYDVRFSILKSLFECLKPGGRISIQMGYGVPSPGTVSYYKNYVQARGTNRIRDVAIGSPDEVRADLEKIGFRSFEYWIRPVGPGDAHPNWIFFTALKPTLFGPPKI